VRGGNNPSSSSRASDTSEGDAGITLGALMLVIGAGLLTALFAAYL
jgi:hypothetical protein